MAPKETSQAIEAVWRIEAARVIAGVARLAGDVGLAEELAQDALVAALEQWPREGVPTNPGAWLMTTAKRRAIDQIRRRERWERSLAEARVPFELPVGAARTERLASVLEVIYLIFNEGYSATAGDDWMRPALCEEAMRLGRVLAGLMPEEAEVHGLIALLEIQASRSAARTGPSGEPIVLLEQDRRRWDRLLINRGLAALEKAESLGGGTYTLQAAIAACHARARTAEETDWPRIASLYARLAELAPSPIVELNRAVAVAMAAGPAAGLAVLDPLRSEASLRGYHLLPSVRGDFLARLGRTAEAKAEFERAATMTRNDRERTLLLDRAAALD